MEKDKGVEGLEKLEKMHIMLQEIHSEMHEIRENMATKQDLARLEAMIENNIARLEKKLENYIAQAWYWKKEWQEGEREADRDIQEGRTRACRNLADLFLDLEEGELDKDIAAIDRFLEAREKEEKENGR